MIIILYKREIVIRDNNAQEILDVAQGYTINHREHMYGAHGLNEIDIKENDRVFIQIRSYHLCIIDKR